MIPFAPIPATDTYGLERARAVAHSGGGGNARTPRRPRHPVKSLHDGAIATRTQVYAVAEAPEFECGREEVTRR
jgi:hypothetical protein